MTRDDLYAHYRRFYVPANATLVVVGDVDTDDVLRRASDCSAAFRRRRTVAPQGLEPPQAGSGASRSSARAQRRT